MKSREEVRREIERYLQEPVPPAEYERWRSHPVDPEEVAELIELVRWFRRRYPSLKERFAYVRRMHTEWTRPVTD